MIIELQGQAGVGKYTIGRQLAAKLDARLVDNHSIYNPAFVSTDFGSVAFYEMARAVRKLVFDQLRGLPRNRTVILTIAPGRNGDWGREWQQAIRSLADDRTVPLLGLHLYCDEAEALRRIATPSRTLMHKLTDPAMLFDGFERPVLLDHCDQIMELDVTSLGAEGSAQHIADWIGSRAM